MEALKTFDIKELLRRQAMLDEKFKDKMGTKEIDPNKIRVAYIDEVGEFIHELKPKWCYWKNNFKEMDKRKTLEELSDCMHFALSLKNNKKGQDFLSETVWSEFLGGAVVLSDKIEENLVQLSNILNLEFLSIWFELVGKILENLDVSQEEFLKIHHEKWLKNMNERTKESY